MSVTECLRMWGGISTRQTLIRATSRAELDRAVRSGAVVIEARGRYCLAGADPGLRHAHAMTGVLSHRSAAAHWGWEQRALPEGVDVTIPRTRRPRRVRRGTMHPAELVRLAGGIRGRGAPGARSVAAAATGAAANPFESVLRALCLQAGLDVVAQAELHRDDGPRPVFVGRPDLLDRQRRIVIEADSYRYHGGRAEFARDCRRLNDFQLCGQRCLRFSWEDTMHHPERVLEVLRLVQGPHLPFLLVA